MFHNIFFSETCESCRHEVSSLLHTSVCINYHSFVSFLYIDSYRSVPKTVELSKSETNTDATALPHLVCMIAKEKKF